MEAYQQRVINEKAALDGSIERLGLFIRSDHFGKLPKDEQERMERQHATMVVYSAIFGERIAAWGTAIYDH